MTNRAPKPSGLYSTTNMLAIEEMRELPAGEVLSVEHPVAAKLGADAAEVEGRLREMTRAGMLTMRAARSESGAFVRYEWIVSAI
jgi:hypothetical protein